MSLEQQIAEIAERVDRPTKRRHFDDDEVEFLKESVAGIWDALVLIAREVDRQSR